MLHLRLRLLASVGVVAGLAALIHYQHWDDQVRLLLQEQNTSSSSRAASIWLPGYAASIESKPLAGLEEDEASDLAYSPLTGTLFTVTGKLPMLIELSRTGEVLRRSKILPDGREIILVYVEEDYWDRVDRWEDPANDLPPLYLNVPVRDPAALADALHELLADAPLRQRMGSTARQRYEAEFRAELMTQRVLELYRRLALR